MFGLNTAQLIELIDNLRARGMLIACGCRTASRLAGFQYPQYLPLREACRVYTEMAREGVAMGIINIGGGLAVDYDVPHQLCFSAAAITPSRNTRRMWWKPS